jgi:hypothetical protein
LSRPEDAAKLLEETYKACKDSRGEDDMDTLAVKEKLGAARFLESRFRESLELHEQAAEGLGKILTRDHEDTLRSISSLGKAVGKMADFNRAVELHEEAYEGLRKDKCLGPIHADTLSAKESLALALWDRQRYLQPSEEDLNKAFALESEVVEQRRKKLGRQHPYTLWSICNLAKIKAARGDFEEAEHDLRVNLPIAEMNLSQEHLGVLMAKAQLGHFLVLRGKLDDAEELLVNVIATYDRLDLGRYHGDNLVALAFLIKCYTLQRKDDEARQIQERMIPGIRRIFGKSSFWEGYYTGNYK